MSTENLLSRRLALARFALFTCAAVVTPTILIRTKAFAEETETPDSAETSDSTDAAETESADATEIHDDDAGTVAAPSAAAIAPVSGGGTPVLSKKKKHTKK